jgi:hypothetical protein
MTLALPALARWMQGFPPDPMTAMSLSAVEGWMHAAMVHNVDGLICHSLPEFADTAPEFYQQAKRRTLAAAARHALQLRALERFSGALGKQQALVFKGMALADYYPAPELRHKVDVDVLIRADQREACFEALFAAGFTAIPSNFSSTVLPERTFALNLGGSEMHIDLHWQLSARPLLSRALNFDALAVNATANQNLLFPDPTDALLIACAHRLGHHRGHERLLWLYDIALLLAHVERGELLARARTRGLCGILADGIAASGALFELNPDPRALLERLSETNGEPATRLLSARSVFSFDWSTSDWATRAKLVSERAFAESGYLRARFGNWPLPLLHVARWLQALKKRRTT